jgi:hypothetical protein
VVLYLLECVRLTRPNELVLEKRLRAGYLLRKPLLYPSDRWGWILLNPFRLRGAPFFVSSAPHGFAGSGVLIIASEGAGEAAGEREKYLYPYEPSRWTVEEDGRVTLEHSRNLVFGSLGTARQFVQAATLLRAIHGDERTRRIEKYEETQFNVSDIRKRASDFRDQTAVLNLLAPVQFFLCFVVFPASLAFLTLRLAVLGLAPIVFAVCVRSAVLYFRTAKRLFPDGSRVDLYGNTVKLLLYPIASMRSVDLLSAHLMSAYDPIAVLTAFDRSADAARLLAEEVTKLRYRAIAENLDETEARAIRDYRMRRLKRLEQFGAHYKLPFWTLLQPRPAEPGCLSYCPLCKTQYKVSSGACSDCRDMILQPIDAAAGKHGR